MADRDDVDLKLLSVLQKETFWTRHGIRCTYPPSPSSDAEIIQENGVNLFSVEQPTNIRLSRSFNIVVKMPIYKNLHRHANIYITIIIFTLPEAQQGQILFIFTLPATQQGQVHANPLISIV